jgi:hypothetical protein
MNADSSYRQLLEESPDYFREEIGRWTLRPSPTGPQVVLLNAALMCDSTGHYGDNPTRRVDLPVHAQWTWGRTVVIYEASGYR